MKKLLKLFLGGWKLKLIMWLYDFIVGKIEKEVDKREDHELEDIKKKRKEVVGSAYKAFKAGSSDEFIASIDRVRDSRKVLREKLSDTKK